ncbi:MAG: hypothetical protein MHM6MM_007785 [Cercozoa sp. M6MM]
MNTIREVERLNEQELKDNLSFSASWHYDFRNSPYVYVGGLDYRLNEADVICMLSQFGEVVDCNLARDKDTGRSKGFAFVAFEDPRSCVLAVDNLCGVEVCERPLRVQHVKKYRRAIPLNELEQRKEQRAKAGEDSADEGDEDEEYEARRRQVWDERHMISLQQIDELVDARQERKLREGRSDDSKNDNLPDLMEKRRQELFEEARQQDRMERDHVRQQERDFRGGTGPLKQRPRGRSRDRGYDRRRERRERSPPKPKFVRKVDTSEFGEGAKVDPSKLKKQKKLAKKLFKR